MPDAPLPAAHPAVPTRGRVGRWVRLVAVLAVGLGLALPALAVAAWFGFAGARFGWLSSPAALGSLGAATGWLAVHRSWARARRRTAGGLAAVLAVLGLVLAATALPTPGRLRHAIRALERPGWVLVDDRIDGNALCFDSCTSVTRVHRVDTGFAATVEAVGPALARRGLAPLPRTDPDRVEFAGTRGDVHLRVTVIRAGGGTTTIEVRADARG